MISSWRLNQIIPKSIGRTFSVFSNQPRSSETPVAAIHPELSSDHINQILVHAPQLRQYDQSLWHRTFNVLSDQGFTPAGFVQIISNQPSLLTRQPDHIVKALESWRSTQFGDQRVQELLQQYPELFNLGDERILLLRVAFLKMYAGTDKNIWRLFMNSPNLIVDREELIQSKIDYFNDTMRVEVSDVTKSTGFSHTLDNIATRHTFLDRLGLFTPRSPKADPMDPNRNPRMHQIYDTTDKEFTTKICGVSMDEYEVFQELFRFELEKEKKKYSSDAFDE